MMQQINLYTEEFKPKKVVLPLDQIVLSGALALILCVGFTVLVKSRISGLDQILSRQTQHYNSLQTRAGLLEKKADALRIDESMVNANKRLKERADNRAKMLQLLDSVVISEDRGFSPMLVGLARQRADKLWLTRIEIANSGADLAIEGRTTKPDSVPIYLQSLRKEPSFLGRSFTLFNLKAVKGSSSQLEFSLKSRLMANGKGIPGRTDVSMFSDELGAVKGGAQ
jgi:hypothetical protein